MYSLGRTACMVWRLYWAALQSALAGFCSSFGMPRVSSALLEDGVPYALAELGSGGLGGCPGHWPLVSSALLSTAEAGKQRSLERLNLDMPVAESVLSSVLGRLSLA